jgi:DNA-binding NtrC family response regulator
LKPFILVVDDEPEIRRLLHEILEDEGYAVAVAKDGASARDAVATRKPNLILLDIWMPDVDGISLLKEFTEVYQLRCPVIMMSGHGTVEAAVEATRLGAFDFIEKPLSLSKILMTVESALSEERPAAVSVTHSPVISEPVEVVGKSAATQQLIEELENCAKHDVSVLIHGEPGVGKLHSAKFIHTHSERRNEPFIELHTAALPTDQSVELLLGKEVSSGVRPGLLEQAGEGALYIDDVAELSEEMQRALFGALTAPAIVRAQGDHSIEVHARVIAATRYDLEQEVRAGRFREDLFHRLNTYPVYISPLRERVEDITDLLAHFVRVYADRDGLPYRNFSVAAQNRLRNHSWSGNVLELENLVHRLLISGGQPSIEQDEVERALQEHVSDTPLVMPSASGAFDLPLRQAREQFEKAYLQYHLHQTDGSVGKVAKLAGMERTHLYRKLRSLGIDTKHLSQSAKDN